MLRELLFITVKVTAIFKIHERAASVDMWPAGRTRLSAALQIQLRS